MIRGQAAAFAHVDTSDACPSARIVGYIPTGMLDWPGKIASTVFLAGCPLRCPYCHNPDLLHARSQPASWQSLLAHLSVRRGWIDGVVVTGGEPTADPDLVTLLEELAARGVPVKMDTNGTSPAVLRKVLSDGLVRYVALDIKTLPERYGAVGADGAGEAVLESIRVLLESGVAHEFRTTVYPPLVALDELPLLAQLVRGGERYVLQQFRPARTLDPAAGTVRPYNPGLLADSATACSAYLPTTVRGA